MPRSSYGALVTVIATAIFTICTSAHLLGQATKSTGLQKAFPPHTHLTLASRPTVLAGIKKMRVLVEALDKKATDAGLSRETITTDVELKLREAGITILGEGDAGHFDLPELYVRLTSMKTLDGSQFACYVHVRLMEDVRVERDLNLLVWGAATWETGGIMVAGNLRFVDGVRSGIKDEIDIFLNDYLKANPKNAN